MYPYHNQIKRRIKNGELSAYEFGSYKNIGECLILHFSTYPNIRPHKYAEYVDILADWNRGKFSKDKATVDM